MDAKKYFVFRRSALRWRDKVRRKKKIWLATFFAYSKHVIYIHMQTHTHRQTTHTHTPVQIVLFLFWPIEFISSFFSTKPSRPARFDEVRRCCVKENVTRTHSQRRCIAFGYWCIPDVARLDKSAIFRSDRGSGPVDYFRSEEKEIQTFTCCCYKCERVFTSARRYFCLKKYFHALLIKIISTTRCCIDVHNSKIIYDLITLSFLLTVRQPAVVQHTNEAT